MSIRTLGSACNQAGQVERYLGTAYDIVKKVADNLEQVKLVNDMLAKYGVLLCFDDPAQLATVDPKLAKFARVYDTRDAMNLYYKDYVYQADTTDGLAAKGGVGAWVEMDSINSVFGQMAWVYNDGVAAGGETELELDIETLSITDLYINGSYQTYGLNFTFDPATQVISLSQELLPGDMVVAKLSGVPAMAPSSSVDNFHFLNFVYNEGSANGGETVVSTGIPFMNITSVFKNGKRLLHGKDYTYSATSYTITFAVPLTRADEVQATLGGNLDELAETTGAMASKTVKYYQLAKDMIDKLGLSVSQAGGYANNAEESAQVSSKAAAAASGSAASALAAQSAAEEAQAAAQLNESTTADSALAASNSAQQAANSAASAEENRKTAVNASETAKASADTATSRATAAGNSAKSADASMQAAGISETNAAQSASAAADSVARAQQLANAAGDGGQQAATAATDAINAAGEAKTAAETATAAQKSATDSAAAAGASESNAKTSETGAAASAKAAKESEDKAVAAGASYTNLQSSDADKGDALIRVLAPYTGAVAITQHLKNTQSVFAPEMGLVPGTNVQEKFNAALVAAAGAGKELVVPAGVYTINGSIRIPTNTRLRLEPGAVIQRDPSGTTMRIMIINAADGVTGGYDANANILIYGGGTVDGNQSMLSTACSAFAFSHCHEVLLTDLDIINLGGGGHAVEFNASRNAFGINVRARVAGNPTTITNEAFQIDAAVSDTYFPWFGPYDSTVCDHVGFINCQISGFGVGIGSNSDGAANHKNITLRDNRIVANIVGINMTGWDNVALDNNEISWGGQAGTTMIAGIQGTFNTFYQSQAGGKNMHIKDNYIHDIVPADLTVDPGSNWYGIRIRGAQADLSWVRDLLLSDNHIENTGNAAVYAENVSSLLVKGNRMGAPKCTGAAGLESLDIRDSSDVQVFINRLGGSVTIGKGTRAAQKHMVKDNLIGGTLAVNATLFTKGQVTGNQAVVAVPETLSETARIVANNTVG